MYNNILECGGLSFYAQTKGKAFLGKEKHHQKETFPASGREIRLIFFDLNPITREKPMSCLWKIGI